MDYGFCWNWTWRDVEKRRAKKKEAEELTEYAQVGREGNCARCGHPCDKHAFDVYPIKNPNRPCELSCIVCFDEETERMKKEDGRKMTTFECTCGKVCSDLIQLRQHQADEIVAMAKKEGIV